MEEEDGTEEEYLSTLLISRRNHSNCPVIELYQTQSNLIERLGSIKFGNLTQSKQKICVKFVQSELNRTNRT